MWRRGGAFEATTYHLDTVHEFVLEHNNRIGITDGGLDHTTGVLSRVWRENFEPRDTTIPRSETLTVLRPDTSRIAVGPPEYDGDINLPCRHIK